jgi:hypothetical protein
MPDLPVDPDFFNLSGFDPDLGKWKFHREIFVNQKNYVKLQIGMFIK